MSGRTTSVLQGRADETPIRVPLVEIEGVADGPVLSIVAGVHGSEYPGILAAIAFSREVRAEDLRGTVRVVPILTETAFYGRAEAVCPVDGKNPNRVFPGDPAGSYTDVVNHMVFERVVRGSDCVINVHGGDIFEALVPYAGLAGSDDPEISARAGVLARSRELALAYDLPFLVKFAAKSSVSYGFDLNTACNRAGIPAFLAEAGGNGLPDLGSTGVHLKGMRNVARAMGMIDGEPERDQSTRELVSSFWRAKQEGIFHPRVSLGEEVREGQEIGTITDWFGEEVETITAERDAWIIAIVTTPAARAGAIVYQVAYRE